MQLSGSFNTLCNSCNRFQVDQQLVVGSVVNLFGRVVGVVRVVSHVVDGYSET